MIELILGGARSGKSTMAEQKAIDTGLPVTYIATASPDDDEMDSRISHHKSRRPDHWQLIEEPLLLGKTIKQLNQNNHCLLIDCLTLWITNLLMKEEAGFLEEQTASLLENLIQSDSTIILVSNETGMGVVPLGEISRRFVDESGRLHQTLASMADKVTLSVAGLPMILKENNAS